MRTARLLAAVALMLAAPALAQDAEPEAAPEFNCDQKDLPVELSQLCLGLTDGYRDAISRPAEFVGKGRPDLKPSLARPPLSQEITGRGLVTNQTDALGKDPFAGSEDRGVGVRMRADGAPVQFSTEMVQPGNAGDTLLNWELKAEQAPAQSGLFFGGATAGTYDPANPNAASETLSGFAGVRGIINPADNVQIGAEFAPRLGAPDFVLRNSSLAFEPKLTAKSDLGRLGASDFVGSINADAGYNVPVEGDPTAWGGVRLLMKPK
jgi:hypothetical protein